MKIIKASQIVSTISDLAIESNINLPEDIQEKICTSCNEETFPLAKNILSTIKDNYELARKKGVPICQDTGIACVFIEIGQNVQIEGNLNDAINEGVRQGYKKAYLRNSVVADPLFRQNTNDNTPAMIYYDIIDGDDLKITFVPKGFGSENMSQIRMLKPSDGVDGVKDFVIECVKKAGPNPCPPIVVGIGIGGTFDKAALLAKKALIRNTNIRHQSKEYELLEIELLDSINKLGIGPQGIGGKTTALAVNIEKMPTHIAGLPVAVNISCHVTRHAKAVL